MSSNTVEKIKERLDILDVVGSYVELKKAGSTYKARCPFHNERTPSFTVSPERGTFYCFGCHAKGDIFSFVEQIEGVDFKGALKTLAERAGVELVHENPQAKSETERQYSILEHAKSIFASNLERSAEHRDYLSSRGVLAETVRDWAIGYAEADWRALYERLRSLKFTDAEMEKAGLIKRRDNQSAKDSERYYDTFRDRIMFPIFDSSGRVVGFSGRTLSKDPNVPKYLNSPETPLFNKSELLYGLHKAKAAIRKKNYSILVEGQMDLIMCHQAGFADTVAASGTALTSGHLNRLKKLSPRIIMAYDSDSAGINAAEKNGRLALRHGFEVKIAELPEGKDPADLILSDQKAWSDALKASKHIVDFELDRLVKEYPDKHAQATALVRKVLPFIGDLGSSVEKSHYVLEASRRTGMREEAIWEDLKRVPSSAPVPAAQSVPATESAKPSRNMFSLERRIMGMIYWKPELLEFQKKVAAVCGEEKFLEMKENTAEDAEALIFETENYYEGKDIIERDMRELLASLERKSLEEELERMQTELRQADGEEERALNLMKSIHELAQRLEKVKRAT